MEYKQRKPLPYANRSVAPFNHHNGRKIREQSEKTVDQNASGSFGVDRPMFPLFGGSGLNCFLPRDFVLETQDLDFACVWSSTNHRSMCTFSHLVQYITMFQQRLIYEIHKRYPDSGRPFVELHRKDRKGKCSLYLVASTGVRVHFADFQWMPCLSPSYDQQLMERPSFHFRHESTSFTLPWVCCLSEHKLAQLLYENAYGYQIVTTKENTMTTTTTTTTKIAACSHSNNNKLAPSDTNQHPEEERKDDFLRQQNMNHMERSPSFGTVAQTQDNDAASQKERQAMDQRRWKYMCTLASVQFGTLIWNDDETENSIPKLSLSLRCCQESIATISVSYRNKEEKEEGKKQAEEKAKEEEEEEKKEGGGHSRLNVQKEVSMKKERKTKQKRNNLLRGSTTPTIYHERCSNCNGDLFPSVDNETTEFPTATPTSMPLPNDSQDCNKRDGHIMFPKNLLDVSMWKVQIHETIEEQASKRETVLKNRMQTLMERLQNSQNELRKIIKQTSHFTKSKNKRLRQNQSLIQKLRAQLSTTQQKLDQWENCKGTYEYYAHILQDPDVKSLLEKVVSLRNFHPGGPSPGIPFHSSSCSSAAEVKQTNGYYNNDGNDDEDDVGRLIQRRNHRNPQVHTNVSRRTLDKNNTNITKKDGNDTSSWTSSQRRRKRRQRQQKSKQNRKLDEKQVYQYPKKNEEEDNPNDDNNHQNVSMQTEEKMCGSANVTAKEWELPWDGTLEQVYSSLNGAQDMVDRYTKRLSDSREMLTLSLSFLENPRHAIWYFLMRKLRHFVEVPEKWFRYQRNVPSPITSYVCSHSVYILRPYIRHWAENFGVLHCVPTPKEARYNIWEYLAILMQRVFSTSSSNACPFLVSSGPISKEDADCIQRLMEEEDERKDEPQSFVSPVSSSSSSQRDVSKTSSSQWCIKTKTDEKTNDDQLLNSKGNRNDNEDESLYLLKDKCLNAWEFFTCSPQLVQEKDKFHRRDLRSKTFPQPTGLVQLDELQNKEEEEEEEQKQKNAHQRKDRLSESSFTPNTSDTTVSYDERCLKSVDSFRDMVYEMTPGPLRNDTPILQGMTASRFREHVNYANSFETRVREASLVLEENLNTSFSFSSSCSLSTSLPSSSVVASEPNTTVTNISKTDPTTTATTTTTTTKTKTATTAAVEPMEQSNDNSSQHMKNLENQKTSSSSSSSSPLSCSGKMWVHFFAHLLAPFAKQIDKYVQTQLRFQDDMLPSDDSDLYFQLFGSKKEVYEEVTSFYTMYMQATTLLQHVLQLCQRHSYVCQDIRHHNGSYKPRSEVTQLSSKVSPQTQQRLLRTHLLGALSYLDNALCNLMLYATKSADYGLYVGLINLQLVYINRAVQDVRDNTP
jgi:hypothetical protein